MLLVGDHWDGLGKVPAVRVYRLGVLHIRSSSREFGWVVLPSSFEPRSEVADCFGITHPLCIHPSIQTRIHPSIQICNQPATPATPPPRRARPAALSGSEQLLDEVARHAVEEEAQHDEQQQGQHNLDDQPLVAVAHQVADGFQRAQEPQEGGVRATAGWGRGDLAVNAQSGEEMGWDGVGGHRHGKRKWPLVVWRRRGRAPLFLLRHAERRQGG